MSQARIVRQELLKFRHFSREYWMTEGVWQHSNQNTSMYQTCLSSQFSGKAGLPGMAKDHNPDQKKSKVDSESSWQSRIKRLGPGHGVVIASGLKHLLWSLHVLASDLALYLKLCFMADMEWRRGLKFLQHKEKMRIIQSNTLQTSFFFFFCNHLPLEK